MTTPPTQLEDGFATIQLWNDNHWIAVIKDGGEFLEFDSKPYQEKESCGVFATLVILTYSQGGLTAVKDFWNGLELRNADWLAIEALQRWINQSQ
ncbi:MAG: hypothetical protein GY816_21150 [Cytophagales bacterium]|nr:hypothetical protein [Cytophagales bacterium]